MEDNEIKGKVTVIVQSKTKTTKDLESDIRSLLSNEGNYYVGDMDDEDPDVEVFVVPSDDVL